MSAFPVPLTQLRTSSSVIALPLDKLRTPINGFTNISAPAALRQRGGLCDAGAVTIGARCATGMVSTGCVFYDLYYSETVLA